ncbi:hypothetical protein BDM02DRAFT_3213730 [Thelephora ganbajun]|uniref:Uncharacterized protein n=1 Tax=Thelephora ganbajun TaxID=370292 RepID=A0ACB6Z3P1_THEGA|nr:hypothetical protein BDM02DRAFT_3213730 [Thelephora ganbajun]
MSTDPTAPQPRVIVLCFDGTANQYSAANTNVVKFYALLDKCCPPDQIVYYQPGIGTWFNPGVVSPFLTWLAKIADEAIAWYLDEHVRGGYKFLMQNYRQGDKVCLFGFSRGAYTARALAGLLHKIGLLPRDNEEQIAFAYSLYTRTDKAGLEIAAGFKQTFCAPVTIDFVGVWDTVASVGLIYSRNLPFTTANSGVRVFRHALSLDEHRARFQPNLFHRETPKQAAKRKKGESKPTNPVNATTSPNSEDDERTKPRSRPKFGFTRWGITVQRLSSEEQHRVPGVDRGVPSSPKALSPERRVLSGTSSEVLTTSEPLPAVQEVWFVGCHADVGGSAVEDTVRYSLADISLRWMVKQVILSQCGIRFDAAALKRADIDVATIALAGAVLPTSPSSSGGNGSGGYITRKGKERDVEEQNWPREEDVLADIHDELKIHPLWWILEIVPMKFKWQEADGTWKSEWSVNLGRGRQIRTEQPDFHDTVRQRMAVVELKYQPRAKWTRGTERYVD